MPGIRVEMFVVGLNTLYRPWGRSWRPEINHFVDAGRWVSYTRFMRTAGVIFDFYDDPAGEILKRRFPAPENLPGVIKTAHILTPEEREVLRDEAYALVGVNEGHVLRKFACVDAGNTMLSMVYFEETGDLLPEKTYTKVAGKLLEAAESFGLEPTPKLAAALVRTRAPQEKKRGNSDDWAQRTNIESYPGGADDSRVMESAGHLNTKQAMDLSGDAPVVVHRERHERTALGTFPLDSMADVQKAVDYFINNQLQMTPQDRHEFAVKTAARADEIGVALPALLRRYGSTEYAADVDAHLYNRKALRPEYDEVWDALIEKRAEMTPDLFVEMLEETDIAAGLNWYWGGPVCDPYLATFGGENAQEKLATWSWQGRTGDYVTAEQLHKLARNGRPLVHKHFSSEITNAFCNDPLTIFESMPDDTKIILARLASQEFDGLVTN